MQVHDLPLDRVVPNADQPRKIFDEAALHELAASIRHNGLIQPIKVRPKPPGMYEIVAGERRWRAHQLAGMDTIKAIVQTLSREDRDIQAIIENDARVDTTPLEQARAYQRMLDLGMTLAELAKRVGKEPWRITERTNLLRLKPDYLDLFEKGQLSPSQAQEMSRLAPRGQEKLFDLIRRGQCESYNALRAAANGLAEAENQTAMFDEPDPPTDDQKKAARSFEDKIDRIAALAGAGFKDGELVAVQKVAPGRCAQAAEKLKLVRKHLETMEKALRAAAAQEEMFA